MTRLEEKDDLTIGKMLEITGYGILEQIYAERKSLVYRVQRPYERQSVILKLLNPI